MEIKNENKNYRLSYAQSLFQSGLFDEAFKNTTQITEENLKEKVLQLQSAIRYSNEDYAGAQSILLQRKVSHETTLNDEGCLFYQVHILPHFSYENTYFLLMISCKGECVR